MKQQFVIAPNQPGRAKKSSKTTTPILPFR